MHTKKFCRVDELIPRLCVVVHGGSDTDPTVLAVLDGNGYGNGVVDLLNGMVLRRGAVDPVLIKSLECVVESGELFDGELMFPLLPVEFRVVSGIEHTRRECRRYSGGTPPV